MQRFAANGQSRPNVQKAMALSLNGLAKPQNVHGRRNRVRTYGPNQLPRSFLVHPVYSSPKGAPRVERNVFKVLRAAK